MTDLNQEIESVSPKLESSDLGGVEIEMDPPQEKTKIKKNSYKPIKFKQSKQMKRKSAKCLLFIFVPSIFILVFLGSFLMGQQEVPNIEPISKPKDQEKSTSIKIQNPEQFKPESPKTSPLQQREQISPPPQKKEEISPLPQQREQISSPPQQREQISPPLPPAPQKKEESKKEIRVSKGVKYLKSRAQILSVPNFECKTSYFANWDQSKASNYVMKDEFKISKLPYPQLILVYENNIEIPRYHYPDLVTYLKEFPASKHIYIHSAPVYSVLLVGAASPDSVSIIVSETYSEKYLLKTNFVMNNIRDKLIVEQQGNPLAKMEDVSYIVTTSPDFAKAHIGSKRVIFIVEKEEQNPAKSSLFKITQEEECKPVQLMKSSQQILEKGIYVNHEKN